MFSRSYSSLFILFDRYDRSLGAASAIWIAEYPIAVPISKILFGLQLTQHAQQSSTGQRNIGDSFASRQSPPTVARLDCEAGLASSNIPLHDRL